MKALRCAQIDPLQRSGFKYLDRDITCFAKQTDKHGHYNSIWKLHGQIHLHKLHEEHHQVNKVLKLMAVVNLTRWCNKGSWKLTFWLLMLVILKYLMKLMSLILSPCVWAPHYLLVMQRLCVCKNRILVYMSLETIDSRNVASTKAKWPTEKLAQRILSIMWMATHRDNPWHLRVLRVGEGKSIPGIL